MSAESASNPERLDQILAEYMEEVEALTGGGAALETLRRRYLADHLDLASELENHFEAEDAFGREFAGSDAPPDFERYTQVAHIGQGAMGVVYKAFDKELERWVALKMSLSLDLVTEGEARRFRIEAQSMARLKHPNIVRVFDVNDYDGRPFLSMELVSGGTLAEHLERFRPNPRAAARLMVGIARAVHHAHQRGILHRDLKPSNILLDTDEHGPDRPHVSDFGLAKPIDSTESPAERRARLGPGTTEYGKIVGTASYMSPEQASGKDATTLSDVYGLGGIFYALLTGRAPYRGTSVVETLEQVRSPSGTPLSPRQLNPKVDPTLEAVCLKCLEKGPERRYQSAEGLAKELERWLDHHPTEARPLGPIGRIRLWGHRRPLGVGLAGALLVLCALIGWNVYDQVQQAWRDQGDLARFEAATIRAALEPLRAVVGGMAADPRLGAWLREGNDAELQSYLMDSAGGIDDIGAVSPFASCYVMKDGYIQARWRELAELDTDFRARGYYTQVLSAQEVVVSDVFFSVSDHFFKFAIAAPVFESGRVAGILACSVETTADIGVTRMEEEGFSIAVLAPRDESRVEGEREAEPPLPSSASSLLVFAHPMYMRGEEPAWLRDAYVAAYPDIFQDGEDGCVDDYVDPVSLDVSSAERYAGSWSACFAHVEGSEFIVVVQRRSGAVIPVAWWVFMGLVVTLFFAAAVIQYLWPRIKPGQ